MHGEAREERKEHSLLLTVANLLSVNKRECSFEGLAAQMENGEDGIYSLMDNNNKNVIFQPKISVTQHDLETIPLLKQLRETINKWDTALKKIAGSERKEAYMMRKALIEMRKDQYVIKQAYQKPIVPCRLTRSTKARIRLEDESYLDGQKLVIKGVSLMDPKVISAILCNYSKLKEDSYDQFDGDTWYLIQAFEDICDKALADFPIYQRIVELKIDKAQNADIQIVLNKEFGTTYSAEYISSLWRNKIPKMIAVAAIEDFLTWQYNINNYPMKRCTKCGQLKPAHNQFFSINKSSKDSLYSICKKCRNKKRG